MKTPGTIGDSRFASGDSRRRSARGVSFLDFAGAMTLGILLVTRLAPEAWAGNPPDIITVPVSQTNYSGDTVTFTVTAGGDAVLYYQWQKNNTNLTDSGNISGSATDALTLANVTAADGGTYSVIITNGAGVTNASATLTVFSRLIQNGGFETGTLAPWSITGNDAGFSVQGMSSGYVHSGDRGARIGPDGSLGYLSQTFATAPGQTYAVSFWLKNVNATPPNEFGLWWNGNAVYDQINLGAFDWTNLQFQVIATATNSVLTFGFQNDLYYFGLDDISVLPTPRCRRGGTAAGDLSFTFQALAGFRYQVQSATNLASGGWTADGGVLFSETNVTISISRPTTWPRQYYRVAILP